MLIVRNIIFSHVYIRLLLSVALPFAVLIQGCQSPPAAPDTTVKVKLPAPALKRMSYEQYGLDVASKQVIQDRLGQDQYVRDILLDYGVTPKLIDTLAARSVQVFDVRNMRAGNPFTLIKGEGGGVQYFIYEKSDADFVVFDLRDSVQIYEGRKQVVTRENGGAWFINSSLFEAIQAQGLDVELARQLEDIFAWSVDFSYLDDTDYFKVIYEEEFVDEVSIGISRIVAAQFHHRGEDYFAFAEGVDSALNYYDELGHNVQRSFLKTPLKYTSSLGPDTVSTPRPNRGLEYVATAGSPVIAVGNGTLTEVKRLRNKRARLKIQHGRIYASAYLNLGTIVDSLLPGMPVEQGQVIGFVGGKPEGSLQSISFRFLALGKLISLDEVQNPKATPLAADELPDFVRRAKRLQRQLARIRPLPPPTTTAYVSP